MQEREVQDAYRHLLVWWCMHAGGISRWSRADLVVRGAPPIVVAINGIHLKGVCRPFSLHGRLHIIMPIECDRALALIAA